MARGSETDYRVGLYGGPLPAGIGRKYLRVSESACRDWGSIRCLGCQLADWTPDRVPFCGAEDCGEGCSERHHCACGNPKLRERLWREVHSRLREELRAKCGV